MLGKTLLLSALALGLAAQTAPLAFEVVSIKPSDQTFNSPRINVGVHIDGAQVHIIFESLRDFIRTAYAVKDYQIVGPATLASEHFDLDAKLPAGATPDQVPAMLQTMLADRFQLQFHRAKKTVSVYELVLAPGGLKLHPSAPAPDSAPDAAPAVPGAKNVNATGSAAGVNVDLGGGAFYSLTNDRFQMGRVTLAQIADILSRYEDRPVVDAVNAAGPDAEYDVDFPVTADDSRVLMIRSGVSVGLVFPPQVMALLDGGTDGSLESGLQAAGLKLESRQSPVDTIVVDRIQTTPRGN